MRGASVQALPGCSLDVVATVQLEALDDGPPRAGSFAEVTLDVAQELPAVPADTLSFVARGRDRDGRLVALGLLAVGDGAAHGPLFRVGRSCALLDDSGAAAHVFPFVGFSVGAGARGALLAGGRDEDGSARSDLVFLDAQSGVVSRTGLLRRRSGASVLWFDADPNAPVAVVAGGAGDEIWEDAERVTLSPLSVDAQPIHLSEPRADAGAVLLASGEGLLVGGRGPAGPLRSLEAIDPARATARTLDLASLATPRIAPTALRLATGEVVVLGGHDAAGAALADVEVFDAAVRTRIATLPFAARAHVDAIALPSGAALVVRQDDGSDAELSLLHLDGIESLGTVPAGARAPRLLPGTDGAPFLFDGGFRRFDPWSFAFGDEGALPLVVDPRVDPLPFGAGAVAALRLDDGAATFSAMAARYDVRTALVVDADTLGLGSTSHLVPDRRSVRVERDGLVIPAGARVAVADALYRGVAVRLGATGRDLPAVELRTPEGFLVATIDDAGSCAWPPASGDAAEIDRDADGTITVRIGGATQSCVPAIDETHPASGGAAAPHVSITLHAIGHDARVRGVSLTRR